MALRSRFTRARFTRGASLVECIVIVGVVALLAMAGFRRFGGSVVSEVEREGQHVAMLDGTNGGAGGGSGGGTCTGEFCTNGINCFVAGTLVTTRDGARPIEAIAAGDIVLSKDVESGALTFEPVLRTFVTPDSELVDVSLRDAPPIRVTPGHPFWTSDRGWIEAQHLAPNEPLVTAGGRAALVEGVAHVIARATVYNFEVERTHTYFVGAESILVHNACTDPFNGTPGATLPPGVDFQPTVPAVPAPDSTASDGLLPVPGSTEQLPITVFTNPPGGMPFTEDHTPGVVTVKPTADGQTPSYDGYYVPWKADTVYITHLDSNSPPSVKFCGTGSMNGCSFFVGGDPHNPLVGHMNYNGTQIPSPPDSTGMTLPQAIQAGNDFNPVQLQARTDLYNQLFDELKHKYPELQNGSVITPNDYYSLGPHNEMMNGYGNAFGVKQPDGTWKFYYKQDSVTKPKPPKKPGLGTKIGNCIGRLCGGGAQDTNAPTDPGIGQATPFWPPPGSTVTPPPPPSPTPSH